MRRAAVPLCIALLAAVAGCRAGSSAHGYIEAGQWTPDLKCKARPEGDASSLDFVDTAELVNDDSFWTFDGSVRFTVAQGRGTNAYALNVGYYQHEYEGRADLTGITFDDTNLNGMTNSVVDLALFKFTYEEPSGSQGGERTGGLIGIHALEYRLETKDADGHIGKFAGSAPMFVIGYKLAYYSQNLFYFASIEWMDLDAITLENVTGEVYDFSSGIRWMFNNDESTAITAGYRTYNADLEMRRGDLHYTMEGVYFSLFVSW